MNRALVCTGVFVGALFFAASAPAFTVQSAFTTGCHETVTTAAFFQAAIRFPPFPDEQVPDGPWEDTLAVLLPNLQDLPRGQRFTLFSILAGVRAPDSEGYSATNLSALRAIQGDPSTQYVHCLRAETDDFYAGNASALEGCRLQVRTELLEAAAYASGERGELVFEVPFALDNYGTFDVEVFGTAFYLGRALHTFEDSFTHSLRTPDMRQVVHVMNYEAAIAGTLEEEQDGMAHSAAADGCALVSDNSRGIANRDRVLAAIEGSADVIRAFVRLVEQVRDGASPEEASGEITSVALKWLRIAEPSALGDFEECVLANDYCNSPWLDIARRQPATPLLGCSAIGAPSPSMWMFLVVPGLLLLFRRRRSIAVALLAVVLGACGSGQEITPLTARVLYPIGGLGDDSLADSILSGVIFARAGAEFTLEQVEPTTIGEAEAQFLSWLEDRQSRQIIIAGSAVYAGFVSDQDCAFGSAQVVLLDASVPTCPALRSVSYRVFGPSFLAGVAAVADPVLSPRQRVGVIGGTDLPPVREFIEGFTKGAEYAGGNVTRTEFVSGDPSVGFSDPAAAAALAEQMQSDVDAILAVAGGSSQGVATQLSTTLTSTQPTYFIGVDIDHSSVHSAVTIGSVLKRVDESVGEAILGGVVGAFAAGDVRVGFQDRKTEFVIHPRKATRVLAGDCGSCDPFDPSCFTACTTLDDVVTAALTAAVDATREFESGAP